MNVKKWKNIWFFHFFVVSLQKNNGIYEIIELYGRNGKRERPSCNH